MLGKLVYAKKSKVELKQEETKQNKKNKRREIERTKGILRPAHFL